YVLVLFRGFRKSPIFYSSLIFYSLKIEMTNCSKNIHICVLEQSTAQKSRFSTRGSVPSLVNRGIPRAGVVHRSRIEKFHAREYSTVRELRNSTCGSVLPLGNRGISRAGRVHRSGIVKSHAR